MTLFEFSVVFKSDKNIIEIADKLYKTTNGVTLSCSEGLYRLDAVKHTQSLTDAISSVLQDIEGTKIDPQIIKIEVET